MEKESKAIDVALNDALLRELEELNVLLRVLIAAGHVTQDQVDAARSLILTTERKERK